MDELKDEPSKKKRTRRSRTPRAWSHEELLPDIQKQIKEDNKKIRESVLREPTTVTYGGTEDVEYLVQCLNLED